MADEKTQYDDDNAESDFNAGFDHPEKTGPALVKTEGEDDAENKPKEGTDGSQNAGGADGGDNAAGGVGADKVDGDESGNADGAADKGADDVDETVTVTKNQLERLLAAADKVDGVDGQISKLFGTTGDLKQIVKNLQEATPKGMKVRMPTEALEAMADEYPYIADHMRKILEGIEGTSDDKPASGDGKDSKAVKPEAIQAIVEDSITRREMKVLEREHPSWRADVGAVDSEGKFDAKHPFRVWLSKESKEYREMVDGTNSPLDVTRALDRFKAFSAAEKRKPAPPPKDNEQAAARKDRLEGAVTQRGDGNPPPNKKTASEEFDAGFKSG